jgi:hypothetical protein
MYYITNSFIINICSTIDLDSLERINSDFFFVVLAIHDRYSFALLFNTQCGLMFNIAVSAAQLE